MGASHSTKLYDPLILAHNSIKNKRFVNSSTTADGYSCYYYYQGCNCDQFYSNSENNNKENPKRKKSSLKYIQSGRSNSSKRGSSSSSKRVHFKQGSGSKTNTISPQKEEPSVIMNSPFRGLRRTNSGNSNSYPYPRTHTTVMVIPTNNRVPSAGSSRTGEWSSTSSIADESPTSSISAINFDVSNTGPSYGFDKRRPPLNRAIPPIPESKSNESIMSQASKSLAGTPCEPKQPTLELVQEVVEDKSVVIENKMAQNLASKVATNISQPNHTVPVQPISTAIPTSVVIASSKIKQPKEIKKQSKIAQPHLEPPKSPLMSMAHSVRNRLTKLGNRFGRSDSHSRSPIRSSTSLISMKPTQIPKTKMAKSSSMEATRNIPSSSALPKTFIPNNNSNAASNEANSSHVISPRSQITLIPSPCRSPRPFAAAEELPKTTAKPSEEKINFPSTILEEPTVISSTEPSPKKSSTKGITSPVSVATVTSSNTDTIYSGRVSSSTRPITSPDWSEASNAKTTAPSITTTTAAVLTSPEKDKSAAENIPPPETKIIIEEKHTSKKASKESGKPAKSPSTPRSTKSEKVSKTPKLAAKFGFGGNKTSKTQKVIPSPKVKVKKGSLILKGTSEERRTEESAIKAPPRKSLSFEIQTKPIEVRRNSEMKLIKRIEKSFIPLLPSHHHNNHKVDNNKNVDMRNMNVRSVNMKNRRAPLAEFESTRVENSPAVELPPIGFDRLSSSPGQRRRAQNAAAAKIPLPSTTLMHDANGNVVSAIDILTTSNLSDFGTKENNNIPKKKEESLQLASTNLSFNNISHDNTMMAKDNFIDKKNQCNGEKKNNTEILETKMNQQKMETSADSIDEPKASTKSEMPMSTPYMSHASTSDSKTSDQNANPTMPQISREDFNELKSKLSVLKTMLQDEKADEMEQSSSFKELSHENQLLRQELLERDKIIEVLRKQLATSTSVKN